MLVFVYLPTNRDTRQRLMDLAGQHELVICDPSHPDREAESQFQRAEVAFGGVPATWVARSAELRWLQLDSVGVEPYLPLDWESLGARITCTNLHGFFATPVAETVLAGVLALYRGVLILHDLQQHAHWLKNDIRAKLRTLEGASVLLLGAGSIGRRLRELFAAFGAQVITFDRAGSGCDISSTTELDAALPQVDIVVAALPDTPATRNLMNSERLSRLRESAVIVNVGRSGVIDETALIDALQASRIAGALLDVTSMEPLPPDHPLWSCGNVLLTQHTAGGTHDEMDRKISVFAENLRRYLSGEPLQHVVDWRQGY